MTPARPALLTLDKVEWLVVDEADKAFEAGETGFTGPVGRITTGPAPARPPESYAKRHPGPRGRGLGVNSTLTTW